MDKSNTNETSKKEQKRQEEMNHPDRHPLSDRFKGSLKMTVPEFRQWLEDKFGETSQGKPITANYTHLCVNYGRLPKEFGGWIIEHEKVHGVKIIKITDKPFDFNKGNRGKRSKVRVQL